MMNSKKQKRGFQRRIFWDVDFDKLDFDRRARFVIGRVFERGDAEDIRQCRRYYVDEKIREVLLSAKSLSERRMHLAAAVIDRPVQDFLCYKRRRLNRSLFSY